MYNANAEIDVIPSASYDFIVEAVDETVVKIIASQKMRYHLQWPMSARLR